MRILPRWINDRHTLFPSVDGKNIYTAIDRKPKKQSVRELQRVRNIRANPQVGLIVDEYDEEWRKLWYVLVRARQR